MVELHNRLSVSQSVADEILTEYENAVKSILDQLYTIDDVMSWVDKLKFAALKAHLYASPGLIAHGNARCSVKLIVFAYRVPPMPS